ncbi:MAG: HAD family phosphatase [Kiritimatiellae bacterium]|nr:HAD family phosphatase [Kiritimatiellia bacterium]
MTRWGAIFDWDGVLVDSSAHHERSWELLAAETGHRLPPGHFQRGFGMKNEQIIPELLGWTWDPAEIRRLSLRKEELFRASVRDRGIAPLPGVREWLKLLDEGGIPRAIASSTHRENIETLLRVTGLDGFQTIVAAEDVERGKPAPDVFLCAAERMHLRPQCCVVFEDAPVGIRAARAAGMSVIAVTTTHPRAALSGADLIVNRLDELTVAQVADLVQSDDRS